MGDKKNINLDETMKKANKFLLFVAIFSVILMVAALLLPQLYLYIARQQLLHTEYTPLESISFKEVEIETDLRCTSLKPFFKEDGTKMYTVYFRCNDLDNVYTFDISADSVDKENLLIKDAIYKAKVKLLYVPEALDFFSYTLKDGEESKNLRTDVGKVFSILETVDFMFSDDVEFQSKEDLENTLKENYKTYIVDVMTQV